MTVGYLGQRTISSSTRRQYSDGVTRFLAFAKAKHLGVEDLTAVDIALERFFDSMYLEGYGPAVGRNALYGWIFFRTSLDSRQKHLFPRASRALKGWVKCAPQQVRDPLPYGVVCLIVQYFLRCGHTLAAAACLWQFDTYFRPSEVISLNSADIVPPAPAAGRLYRHRWTVLVGNQIRRVRTKTRVVDGSIELGGSVRPYMRDIAAELARISAPNSRVFAELSLNDYEGLFRRAAKALNIMQLGVCPHALRHGGASHDAFSKARTLTEIRKRGQWRAFESVARYEKHGKIMRQMSLLTSAQQSECRLAELEAPGAVVRALRLLPSYGRTSSHGSARPYLRDTGVLPR